MSERTEAFEEIKDHIRRRVCSLGKSPGEWENIGDGIINFIDSRMRKTAYKKSIACRVERTTCSRKNCGCFSIKLIERDTDCLMSKLDHDCLILKEKLPKLLGLKDGDSVYLNITKIKEN